MQYLVRRQVLLLLILANLFVSCPLRGQELGIDELLESASAAQSAGNYEAAAAFYARATRLSPSIPELWANRGVMEFLSRNTDASIPSLQHALRLNSNLLTPSLFLGKAYVQIGKPMLALPYLDRAHVLKPDDVEVLLARGKANADLNKQKQAASNYSDAARLAPNNPAAWLGLGQASLEMITADGRVLAADVDRSPFARGLYAEELLAQGRPLEATDKYKAAFAAAAPEEKAILFRNLDWMKSHPDLYPLPPPSREALLRLDEELRTEINIATLPACPIANPPALPKSVAMDEAACAFWAGDYERSATLARQALNQTPKSSNARYWSIKANERIATQALSRFEELAPKSAYVLVGDLYRDQRNPDRALIEYKKALAIDPVNPAALMGAAAAYFTRNQLDEAAATVSTALAQRPLDIQLNLLMAEILAGQNQYAQARLYLSNCLAAPSELQPRIHYLLGRAEMEDGHTEQAIRDFEISLPGDKDGGAHYQLSRLYRKVGKLAQARQAEAEAKVLIHRRDVSATIAVREAAGSN